MALIRNASILFVCTMAGSASNYFFQFVMGKSLSIEDYGAMNALLSVIMAITMPTSAIMLVVAKYASTYAATGEREGISALYSASLKRITLLALAVSAVFMLLSGYVRAYLRIDGLSPVLILSIGIFGSFILTVNFGMLQGLQRFSYLGLGIGLSGVLRLLLGVAFILLGMRLSGALLATALPAVAIFFLTAVPLFPYLRRTDALFRHSRILNYSIPVLFSSVAFAFLSNIDLIMARHFLGAKDVGVYAAVAVLGKTMFYLPSAFALAVFPMVSESIAVEGDSFKILDKALLFTVFICAGALILFALLPEKIIGLLYGPRFYAGAAYLKYYGSAMALLSALSIIISFNLARGKTFFMYSLAAGCVLIVGLLNIFHSGIGEILTSILAVFFALTAFNVWKVYRERHVYYRERDFGICKVTGTSNTEL